MHPGQSSSSSRPTPSSLTYTVHSWSSYSANYHPNNIQYDRPSDQSSRWSSDCNFPPQFIMLKLQRPAVLTSVTFGKYEKSHLCNLQKFRIYGGLNEDSMMELLSSGLKNDKYKETFELKHDVDSKEFPCLFVKIVPLLAWGPNFNFSIWYVSLYGIEEVEYVRPRLKWFNNFREQEAVRLCLKYLRQKNYMDAFDALKKKSKISLEDPLLTELHQKFVVEGDFVTAEKILEESANEGLFQEYVDRQNYKPKWSPIVPLDENGRKSNTKPGMRGGHQMCIDVDKQLLFLFGGWDGKKDLADFWLFNIRDSQWHCISEDTKAEGGPSARSCHKVCFDSKRRHIYVLGRFIEASERHHTDLKGDLYKYELDNGSWHVLSEDTYSEGGPHLIFDHQMLYDSVSDNIYIFGGRALTRTSRGEGSTGILQPEFSGLFSYNIERQTWRKIKNDCGVTPKVGELRSRSGHSMLIDENKRLLYILAGQRGKDTYLSDFMAFNMETEEVRDISSKINLRDFPSAGFTQRSTIDVKDQEIFVLSGLSKDSERKDETIPNAFWVYKINKNEWACIYKNENKSHHYWNKMHHLEPRPRFAHQLVYDPINKVHYLFGGNPGKPASKLRLDDFWELKLTPPTVSETLRRCQYEVRTLRYLELVDVNQVEALSYLQDEVSRVVDHANDAEREEFESLTSSIFFQTSPTESSDEDEVIADEHENSLKRRSHKQRIEVYNRLALYYPSTMVQPTQSLTDFIKLS